MDKFSEGDILVTNCINYPLFLCNHFGIIVIVNGRYCVVNNTPSRVNKFGGNIVCQPINDFLKDRNVIRVIHTDINTRKVENYIKKYPNRKWTLGYNCKTFIDEIKRLYS